MLFRQTTQRTILFSCFGWDRRPDKRMQVVRSQGDKEIINRRILLLRKLSRLRTEDQEKVSKSRRPQTFIAWVIRFRYFYNWNNQFNSVDRRRTVCLFGLFITQNTEKCCIENVWSDFLEYTENIRLKCIYNLKATIKNMNNGIILMFSKYWTKNIFRSLIVELATPQFR